MPYAYFIWILQLQYAHIESRLGSAYLLCSGAFGTSINTPSAVWLTAQCRPHQPGSVQKHNPGCQQASSLHSPGRHRDQCVDQGKHQSEGDEEDIQTTAGMWRPKLVQGTYDCNSPTIADSRANDEHKAHTLLQVTGSMIVQHGQAGGSMQSQEEPGCSTLLAAILTCCTAKERLPHV